ncbi:SdpI family protein [Rhodococcus kronopolitis]|uniref:SdpI family protein n=1 Tax=Rhodococcus kronopolitis TaxID=1460226 RepID=A0ABV9FTH2_9NOCA
MLILAIVLFVLALAVGGVAVAGLAGKLPRNRWAGVRTPETLANDKAFALANRVAGPTLAAAALLLVIGGVGALVLGGVTGVAVALVAVVAALGVAAYGGSLGARVAAALPAEASGCGNDCGCGSAPEPAAADESNTDAAAAAADCGMDSCGSCALKGACLPS